MKTLSKKKIAAVLALLSFVPVFAVINSAGGIKKVVRTAAETQGEAPPEKAEPAQSDEEYKRSVGNVAVSEETFKHDKKDVLEIIDELSVIMEERAYKKWIAHIDKESISYWSAAKNLSKAQSRLPVKGLRLRTMEDYFKFVFIPARRGKNITEIRYESDSYIKAVEITEESGELIYYYFNKINGEWKLHLPPLED